MLIITDEDIILDEELHRCMLEAGMACIEGENMDSANCEVSLSIVGEDEIRSINSQFRGKDSVTDVLSFPQYDDLNEIENDQEICLGDVVICDEVAHRQAEEYGHSYEREFVYLFVHSMLHLLGYDHMQEDEKILMRRREEEVMNLIGLAR